MSKRDAIDGSNPRLFGGFNSETSPERKMEPFKSRTLNSGSFDTVFVQQRLARILRSSRTSTWQFRPSDRSCELVSPVFELVI